MSVNKVIILGRLGQDPELRYTPSGAAVCNFSVATSEYWNDKDGERKEKTEWHRVVTWGKTAELCNQYLAKGRQCFLEGRLQTRSWDDKDGQKKYTTEVIAQTVQFVGSKSDDVGHSKIESTEQRYQGTGDNDPVTQDYNVPVSAALTVSDVPFQIAPQGYYVTFGYKVPITQGSCGFELICQKYDITNLI